MTTAEAICTSASLASLAYLGVARWCFGKWARCPLASVEAREPITFLRPIKRGVPGQDAKLAAMARAMQPGDQLVLGADADSEELALCEKVRADFPESEIVVVACVNGAALNPKVSKLIQMTPHARHERLTVADSEAMLDAEFVAAWRAEWAASAAAVLTAGYVIGGARSWPQRLDAAGLLLTLWPGIVVLRALATIRFTLGACFAIRRADLATVGGWEALAGELAEDHRLGVALAAAGRTIRLSARVVMLESDPLSWRQWWRHQRRVAVTYRAANPWGYAGSLVTHGESWALALVAAGELWGAALFFAVWAGRVAVARGMTRRLGFELPGLALAMLGASLAGMVCWGLNWATRWVWWGGRCWRVSFRGKLGGNLIAGAEASDANHRRAQEA
jgi:ceramide glucosyltransferase